MQKTASGYNFSQGFTECCQPIFKNSPITFCSLVHLHKDGSYNAFMSDPTWVDLYLTKHHTTLGDWATYYANLANVGYELWSLSAVFTLDARMQSLYDDCNAFNYNSGICFVDEHPNYYEIVAFSSPNIEGVDKFFIEKMGLLQNYILYIKEKVLTDRQLANELNVQYQLPAPQAQLLKPNKANTTDELSINRFYLGTPLIKQQYVTKKELDCLLPFILGIPKKIISSFLHISIRTIETHLDNIKQKTNCSTLVELKLLFSKNRHIMAMLPKTLHQYKQVEYDKYP